MDDELQLLRGMLNGDQNAVDVFLDRYKFVIRGAFRRFRQLSEQDCDDLFQDVWERLLDNDRRLLREMVENWQGGSLAGYVRVMAKRMAIDHIRKNGDQDIPIDDVPEPIEEDPNPALVAELRRILNQAVSRLADRCQRIIRMIDIEDQTYQEAAEAMNMKRNAFGVALHNCRERLARIAEREFPVLRVYFNEGL